MILIQDVIVSREVVDEAFMCNLNACKGACCWEGDFGAPLETEELHTLERIYPEIKPFLSEEGIEVLEKDGLFTYYKENKDYGTPLIDGGACAYITYDDKGIANCGIEKAYRAGATDFIKPVSCHLYPIRVQENEKKGFTAINYDQWDICSAACELGKKEKIPVYKFVKSGIIRKFGKEFFEELDSAVKHIQESP